MYNSRSQMMLVVVGLTLIGGPATHAFDFGAPLFAEDLDDRITFEVQYERLDRDIRQDVAFSDRKFSARQQEDRTRLHVSIYPQPDLALRLDAGVVSSEDAEGPVPLAGAYLKYRILTWRGARLSMLAGGSYVDSITYVRSGTLTSAVELAAVERVESYYELGGGIQVSRPWSWTPRWTLHPYAGIAASWMEADGTERFTLETSGRVRTDSSVDFREEDPLLLTAGLTALAERNFGARIEARFVNAASYSASVFFSF